MKTLFLGSTGFLGTALAQNMKHFDNITFLLRNPNPKSGQHQIMGDLNDSETILKISKSRFERVIDCSWEGLPELTEKNNQSNLSSKIKLYDALVQGGVAEINSLGSCLEYGSVLGLVSESTVGQELSDFAKVKMTILNKLMNYGIRFRWFRPFYLIGLNQHHNSLLNSAINSIQFGLDFEPQYPEKSYDYISVEDASRGISMALEVDNCTGIINLGSGESTSVNDVVNRVRRHFGFEERKCAKAPGMISDSSKILNHTGWRTTTSLDSQISKIITSRNRF